MLSTSIRVIGGVGVILLSFWITLKGLQHSQAPSQTIVCHIPLGSHMPLGAQNLPILIVGVPGHADASYLRNEGGRFVIGVDYWGIEQKEGPIDADRVENNALNITVDYTHNDYSIALGTRQVFRRIGPLASTFTTENIAIGINPIGYPNIAPIYPALFRRADGACKARDTASKLK